MNIYVNVSEQRLQVSGYPRKFVAGTVDFVKFIFTLNDQWENLLVTAQFEQSGKTYYQYLDDANSVYLPAGLTDGFCTLSLYGTNGTMTATSEKVVFKILENTFNVTDSGLNQSSDIYSQLVDKLLGIQSEFDIWVDNVSADFSVLQSRINALILSMHANKIQMGRVSIESKADDTVTEYPIVFDTPFESAPIIVCNPITSAPQETFASPQNTSNTGFTIQLYRKSADTEEYSTTVDVFWIAASPEYFSDSKEEAELTDARVGYDGVVYDTLGDAVRTQMAGLDALQHIQKALNEVNFSVSNIYSQGTVVSQGILYGYDKTQSPVTPVYAPENGFEVWKISLEGLTQLTIPFESEYPEDAKVFMLLRPEDGMMLLYDYLMNLEDSSWIAVNSTEGYIELTNLNYWYNKMGYTELYVTKAIGKDHAYIPDIADHYITLEELMDMRTGSDQIAYSTAGEALRGQMHGLNHALSGDRYNENIDALTEQGFYMCENPAGTLPFDDTWFWLLVIQYQAGTSIASMQMAYKHRYGLFIRQISTDGTCTEWTKLVSQETVDLLTDQINTIKEQLVPNERIVAYNQLRMIEDGTVTLFADNALYGARASKYAAVYFDVGGCTDYTQMDDRLIIRGAGIKAANGATVTVNYCKHNAHKVDFSKTIALYTVSKSTNAGVTKKILVIGDSWTNGAAWLHYLVDNFAEDSTNLELLGTRPGDTTYTSGIWKGEEKPNHEGRGGWNAYAYCHAQSHNGFENAFWNPDTEAFDFFYYMEQQGYEDVDMVILALGMNAITVAVDGHYPTTDEDVECLKMMVESIKAYNSNTSVGIWLTPPPGQANGDHQILAKDQRLLVNEAVMDTFAHSDYYDQNVFLIPTNMVLDTVWGYPIGERAVSESVPCASESQESHTETYHTEIRSTYEALHPNYVGNQQIANIVYAYIKLL